MGRVGLELTASCQDAYEARKLAGLLHGSGKAYVARILNVVGGEVVMGASDASAHSVMMLDAGQAESLAAFLQSVLDGEHSVGYAEVAGARVRIAKS